MKVYPVNEDALEALATLNRDATILLAIASGFGGFALDVTKDLLMAAGAPLPRIMFIAGVNAACWVAAAVFAVLGVQKWRERGSKLRAIKEGAVFEGD